MVGSVRPFEFPVAAVTLVCQPRVLGTPVSLVGLPNVLAPATEPEGLGSHRFQSTVPGEDQQVGPRKLPTVFLLNRPKQTACFIEARVVGPAVERCKALVTGTSTSTAVGDAVCAGGMPRHPDEKWPIVPVVGRPPILRRRHQFNDVLLQGIQVKFLELLGVVKILTHRIGQGRGLAENLQVQLIRPPVLVRHAHCVLPSGYLQDTAQPYSEPSYLEVTGTIR